MAEFGINLPDILEAHKLIKPYITRTPLLLWNRDIQSGKSLYLKLENVQTTGSFKIRGCANKLKMLSDQEKQIGVITVSSGNHGRALAWMAAQTGIEAFICVSSRTPPHKIEAIRQLGGNVVVEGDNFDQAEMNAYQLMREKGLTYISSYDDPQIIAGQGTAVLEILEEYPEIDTILVPVGGGGLASGTALAAKSVNSRIKVIGVSMDRAPVMYHSIKAGHPVQLEERSTIADALKGGIGPDNQYTFKMCQALLDDFLVVPDEEIERGMALLLKNQRLIVEGGGAVAMAAALSFPRILGRNTAVLLTGSSVDIHSLYTIYNRYYPV